MEHLRQLVEEKLTVLCRDRIPLHVRHQIRVSFTIRGNLVTLFEERPHYLDPDQWTRMSIARIRFSPDTGECYLLEELK
jgi:hypothetical protein